MCMKFPLIFLGNIVKRASVFHSQQEVEMAFLFDVQPLFPGVEIQPYLMQNPS